MDYHVITQAGAELLLRVVDSQLVIVPPAAAPTPAAAPAAAPAPAPPLPPARR